MNTPEPHVIGHSDPAGGVEETEAEFACAEGGRSPNIFSNTPPSQCRPCKFEIRASVVQGNQANHREVDRWIEPRYTCLQRAR